MAKRTHHSNKNQNRKFHRNGIKKPKPVRLSKLPGINDKRLRNIFYSSLNTNNNATA